MKTEYLSWSRESTFEKCGQQYVYSYLEGLKLPPGVAQVRGQAPHRSSEADLKAKMTTGDLLPREEVGQNATDHISLAFKGEVSIDGEFQGLTVAQAKAVCGDDARKMAWRHHDKIAPDIIPTALELRLRVNFPELPVPYEGVIDLIDRDAIVRDLKTKRKSPDKGFADTSEQLTVYWGLFSAHYQRLPEGLAYDTVWVTEGGKVNHKVQPTTRTPADWQVKVRRSLRFIEALDREIFLPAPVDAWVCSPRWCGYTKRCPFYAGRPRPTS